MSREEEDVSEHEVKGGGDPKYESDFEDELDSERTWEGRQYLTAGGTLQPTAYDPIAIMYIQESTDWMVFSFWWVPGEFFRAV